MTRLIVALICLSTTIAALAACSSGPPGLKACNYFRDEYLPKALIDITLSDEKSLSLVRDEAEKLNEMAQDAEPEIRAAAAALLQSVIREDEPYGDTHMDIQRGVIGACRAKGHWEDRPPPRN